MNWQDGLAAAIQELINRGHTVFFITCGEEDILVKHPYFDVHVTKNVPKLVKDLNPNVILHWGDMTRPNARPLSELGIPMAICFAGGEPLGENYPFFNHVFVESQAYKDVYDKNDVPCSIAFGTNTTLFAPIEQNKLFDTIFPGTFAYWKRHSLYAQATQGLKAIAVGQKQPAGYEEETWRDCLKYGVTLLPHATPETLRYLYAASRVCVVPSMSSGGSQRTVLEALSMEIPLIVTDSDKFDYAQGYSFKAEPTPESLREMINLALDSEARTREYVLDNWSEFTYADSLEKGLESIL